MTTALWFVGHGTRDPEGAAEFHRFVDLVQQELQRRFELPTVIPRCYVELQSPSVTEALLSSGAASVTQVVLAPILLFAAGHRKHDIPAAIDAAQAEYPLLRVTTVDPIGVDEVFAAVAADRLREIYAGHQADGEAVVFVGRGNRDPDAQAQFEQVASMVEAEMGGLRLSTGYLAGSGTKLEDALTLCVKAGANTIHVLPYLLFQGWLTHTLPERVAIWQDAFRAVQIRIGRHLGVDERLTFRVAEHIGRGLTSLANQGTF